MHVQCGTCTKIGPEGKFSEHHRFITFNQSNLLRVECCQIAIKAICYDVNVANVLIGSLTVPKQGSVTICKG